MQNNAKSSQYEEFAYSGKLANIRKIKSQIASDYQSQVYEALNSKDFVSVIFAQKIIMHCLNSKMNYRLSIMDRNNQSLGLTIPKPWIKFFTNSYHVSRIRTLILYRCFLVFKISIAVLRSFTYLIPSNYHYYYKKIRSLRAQGNKFVLLNSNFQNPCIFDLNNNGKFCFSNWYKKYFQDTKIIFLHSMKTLKKNTSNDVLYFKKFPIKPSLLPKFFAQASLLYFAAIKDLFAGSYKKMYCIEELIEDLRVKFTDQSFIPEAAVFNESNGVIRPVYTYQLELRGSNVQFVTLSTSDSVVLQGEKIDLFPWQLSTWSQYFVYDNFQKSVIKKALYGTAANITVTGQIPFSFDIDFEINPRRKFIALFDITPKPFHYGSSSLNDIGSNSVDAWAHFLFQCLSIAKALNIEILYKPKRAINKSDHGLQVSNILKEISSYEVFKILNPNISTHRIIKDSIGVISTPVTTPAFIALQLMIPSAFYCSSKKISINDPVFRGIPILRNDLELKKWMLDLL